ncbi:MAG: hypothetical protein CL946_09470 [Ectothiorhodospiraceae bacterium]|nr:hypothetical protein [Ectothiorhodospiraceae bacterium]
MRNTGHTEQQTAILVDQDLIHFIAEPSELNVPAEETVFDIAHAIAEHDCDAGTEVRKWAASLDHSSINWFDAWGGSFMISLFRLTAPERALIFLHETGVLRHYFPELSEMAGVDEKSVENGDQARSYQHKDVFYHTMQVLRNTCAVTENIWLRFAALLHDIAKPQTKRFDPETGWTFHGHAELGARMVKRIFRRLEYGKEPRVYAQKLVALHLRPMALVDEGVTDSAVRRLLTDAGEEIEDLLTLCRCDITSKNPKKVRRYLDNYERLVDKIHEVIYADRLRDWQPPIDGQDIMNELGIKEGIRVGIMKARVEDAILEGTVANTREAALEYMRSIKQEVMEGEPVKRGTPMKQRLKKLPDHLAQ